MKKVFFGRGSLKKIQSIVEEINAKRILLVTGKESFILSGAKMKIDELLKGVETIVFNDFQPNPRLKDAERGIRILKQKDVDLIVSIGGGSVLDMAKLINILAAQDSLKFFDIVKKSNLISSKGVPLVAIPTTAGSGSQATHFAVVYVDSIKYSLSHIYMLPDYVIVDPLLGYNMPKKLAASSAMDALSQAIESFWSVGSTKKSRRYSAKAIKLILPVLRKSFVSNNNETNDIMALASHLSGKAINISKTTAAHALSYPITAYFNIQHGHAVALTLSKFFIINSSSKYKVIDKRGKHHVVKIMDKLFNILGVGCAKEAELLWKRLLTSVDLSYNLKEIGITSHSDIKKIVENVNIERLGNNPVEITKMMMYDIFEKQ